MTDSPDTRLRVNNRTARQLYRKVVTVVPDGMAGWTVAAALRLILSLPKEKRERLTIDEMKRKES
jgi:hypothetical protein